MVFVYPSQHDEKNLLIRLIAGDQLSNLDTTIFYSTAIITNNLGQIYLFWNTKHGSWQVPSGKFEPGEDALDCLRRELQEEIGCDIVTHDFLGVKYSPFEKGNIRKGHFYSIVLDREPSIQPDETHKLTDGQRADILPRDNALGYAVKTSHGLVTDPREIIRQFRDNIYAYKTVLPALSGSGDAPFTLPTSIDPMQEYAVYFDFQEKKYLLTPFRDRRGDERQGEGSGVRSNELGSEVKSQTYTDSRQVKLAEFEHTADGAIHYTRALIKNSEGAYLALYDTRFDHYQLPGGKVDTGETHEQALTREVEEEIGCDIINLTFVGAKKLLFGLGLYVSNVYEVTISGTPKVMEKEKFSHIGRGKKIDADNDFGFGFDFGDVQYTYNNELCEGGMYELAYFLSGKHCEDYDLPCDFSGLIGAKDNTVYHQYVDTEKNCYVWSHRLAMDTSPKYTQGKYQWMYSDLGKELKQGLKKVYETSMIVKGNELKLPSKGTEIDRSQTPLFDQFPRKDGEKIVDRLIGIGIVRDPQTDSYLCMKRKADDAQNFPGGGIEAGEDPAVAVQRELLEETGYKNLRLVTELSPYRCNFWHETKQANYRTQCRPFVFELINDEQEPVDPIEYTKHTPMWIKSSEVQNFLTNPGGVASSDHLFVWDEWMKKCHRINFYRDDIFASIENGIKTIETRALNPDEPERYFGNVRQGDFLLCINQNTSETVHKKIEGIKQRKTFDELFVDKASLKQIFPHKRETLTTIDLLKDAYRFVDGYVEKIENNGLIGFVLEERITPEFLGIKPMDDTMRIISVKKCTKQYLFHGSSKKFDVLDPAFCRIVEEFGRPFVLGVDTPSNKFCYTKVPAFEQATKEHGRAFHRINHKGNSYLLGAQLHGYVYILPGDQFYEIVREDWENGKRQRDVEYIAFEPITPVKIMEVTKPRDCQMIPAYEFLGPEHVGTMSLEEFEEICRQQGKQKLLDEVKKYSEKPFVPNYPKALVPYIQAMPVLLIDAFDTSILKKGGGTAPVDLREENFIVNQPLWDYLQTLPYRKIIVSNGTKPLIEQILTQQQYDSIFVTTVKKNHPDYFHALLTDFGLDGNYCLLIDDSQENLDSAKQAGIDGILYISVPQIIQAIENHLHNWKLLLESITIGKDKTLYTNHLGLITNQTFGVPRNTHYHMKPRSSARALIVNDAGLVCLMYSQTDDFYKLPGGGVDEGEAITNALIREVREETGYRVLTSTYLGTVEEYREHDPKKSLHHTSYGFLVTVDPQQGKTELTNSEKKAGFVTVWKPIDEALTLVQMNTSKRKKKHADLLISFMSARELLFLQALQKSQTLT